MKSHKMPVGASPLQDVLANCVGEALVVAGQAALSRSVRGICAETETPASDAFVGQLVLWRQCDLPTDADEQLALLHLLREKQAAGLLITLSPNSLVNLSPTLIAEANQHEFPLIVTWADAEMGVLSESRPARQGAEAKDVETLRHVYEIHHQLSSLVLEGGNLHMLARLLARLVRRAVTIETPDLRLLAYANYGELDTAREDSIRQARAPSKLKKILQERGILQRLREAREPVILQAEPEAGMTMERIVAPVLVGNELLGYVWLLAGDRPLGESDKLAIEGAAIVATLIMLRDRVVRASEQHLRQDLLSRLLHDDLENIRGLLHDVRRFGLDLGQASQVLVCAGFDTDSAKAIHNVQQEVSNLMFYLGIQGLVAEDAGLVVTLFSTNAAGLPGSRVSEALLERLPGLRLGLSDPCYTVGDLQNAYRQIRDALLISRHLSMEKTVVTTQDIGYLNLLHKVPEEAVVTNPYYSHVVSLASYDERRDADLLLTLETYLEQGGNSVRAAERLSVHRGTVHYRLNTLADLTQQDLSNPQVQLNFIIALKLYRLRNLSAG